MQVLRKMGNSKGALFKTNNEIIFDGVDDGLVGTFPQDEVPYTNLSLYMCFRLISYPNGGGGNF